MVIDLRKVSREDTDTVLKIYNSNHDFLIHHLGSDHVDERFLWNEWDEMAKHNFTSNVILVDGTPVRIMDYSQNDSGYVYLSLFMLSNDFQAKGLGRSVYRYFESMVVSKKASRIRIDVVDDYENNVIPFWEKMGFIKTGKDELTWGEKTSSVTVMEAKP